MPVISDLQLKLFKTAVESEKPEKVDIEGTLPSWVQGTYLRVGPAKFDFETGFEFRHWLDGYALLQRFEIGKNSILFETKYLQSDAYKKAIVAQGPLINEFGTVANRDPSKGFFSRIVSNLLPEFTDNCYSTIFSIHSDLFVTCDTCFFRKVDGKTLETYEKCDSNKLFGLQGQSAHPLVDDNGDMYNVGFTLFPSAKYSFFKMPKGESSKEMMKKAKTVASFPSRWTGNIAINHSFGMSQNYLVFIEQPYTVSFSKIASSVVRGESLMEMLEWRGNELNRFWIIEKSTGKCFKTEFMSAESFYFMHVISCYEEDNQIIIDLISYESPNMLNSLYFNNLRSKEKDTTTDLSCMQRFVIPLITDVRSVEEGVDIINKKSGCSAIRSGNKIVLEGSNITKRGLEMPTINRKYFGKKIRYVYTSGTFNESCYSHAICKTDLQTGETKTWRDGEKEDYFYPGEPYFIANPEGLDEDDGVVVSALTDSRSGHQDFLVFLDSKTFTELAKIKFKSHIPSGLHGLFLPAST